MPTRQRIRDQVQRAGEFRHHT